MPAESRARRYEFVGGSRDGDRISCPTRVTAGSRVAFPLVADPSRREVYVYLADGRFHFAGFMWRGATGDAAVTGNGDHDRALLAQVDLLRLVLDQLGDLFRHTGYPRGLVVGDWVVTHRNAVGGASGDRDAGDRADRPERRRAPRRDRGEGDDAIAD